MLGNIASLVEDHAFDVEAISKTKQQKVENEKKLAEEIRGAATTTMKKNLGN